MPDSLALPVEHSVDIFTARGKPVKVERFVPQGEGPHPVLIFLHGSGGLSRSGGEYRTNAQNLATRDYLVLLVHYLADMGGSVRIQQINPIHFLAWMQIVEESIAYGRRQPNADPGRIGLVGVSLGAYLSLSVAVQNRRIGAVVDYFGGLPLVFAQNLKQMPPVLILHGEADPVVPVSEARKLERLLEEKGFPYEIKIYHGQGHGFTGPESQDAFDRAVAFLDRHV